MNAISPQHPLVPDGTKAVTFLAEFTSGWQPDWYLNLCAIPAAGGAPVGQSWRMDSFRRDPSAAAQFICFYNSRRYGLYFTSNPLSSPVHGKPSKSDLAGLVAFLLDLDPPDDARPYDERRRDVESLVAKLVAEPHLPVSAVIDSGNGFGVFYSLPSFLPRDQIDVVEAVSALLHQTVAEQVKVDGTHNSDRLMRLPATLNWPNARKLGKGYPSAPRLSSVVQLPMTRLSPAIWTGLVSSTTPPSANDATVTTTARAEAQPGAVEAIIASLTPQWPHITATPDIDSLPEPLLRRFADALDRHSTLRARWDGDAEGLRDASRSGLLMAFVAALRRAKFDVVDAARLAWVYPHGDLADPAKFPKATNAIRAFSRAWCKSTLERDGRGVLPAGFEMTAQGLLFRDDPTEKQPEPRATWVCDPHEVPFACQDERGGGHGLVLRWNTRGGAVRTTIIDRRTLHNDFAALVGRLEDDGLRCATPPRGHTLLRSYLANIKPSATALSVRRGGWHGDAFVVPNGVVIGADRDPVLLHPDAALTDRAFDVAGTLDEWKEGIARFAVGNSRLAIAICAALAAPLLEIAHAESGGLHFVGNSRDGKTSLLRAAGSVWGLGDGKGGQVRQWRATSNGLEGLAAALSDTPLFLDEIGQANARDVGDIVYMLANEGGKTRADRSGHARRSHSWRTIFVSTGERTVGQLLRQSNLPEPAGLQVRLIHLSAEAGAGMGVFENLHGFKTPAELAEHIKLASARTYGSAARVFLHELTRMRLHRPDDLTEMVGGLRDEFVAQHLPAQASGQVKTVALRLGLAAAAGEAAVAFGVLPWRAGEATEAAAKCFRAWLSERGGIEAGEELAVVSAFRRFLIAHGESRFEALQTAQAATLDSDGRETRTINRVGWRRLVNERWEYLIPQEAWRAELCKDIDPKLAVSVLSKRGFLERDRDGYMPKVPIPGRGRLRVYVLRGTILDDE